MKKVVYNVDKFTDFAGKVREVVLCAVSTDEMGFGKELRLGVSVQNPHDNIVNTELAKTIALGKAMKDKSCAGILMVILNDGMINAKVVDALLEQEMEYFKTNPGKYIKGYNKDKELFKTNPDLYAKKFNL